MKHNYASQKTSQNRDLRGAEAALERAARRAREIARKTGTGVVYLKDGKLVIERPETTAADS